MTSLSDRGRNPSTARLNTALILLGASLVGGGRAFPQNIIEFPIPSAASSPAAITAGPDGAVWFTESNASKIGRISSDGVLTEFPIQYPVEGDPADIAAGPDGNLWFTAPYGQIVRMTPTGTATSFPFSFPRPTMLEGPIAAGPDGNMWFIYTMLGPGTGIARITMDGAIALLTPSPYYSFAPTQLVAGPDGAVWFAEESGNRIGRVTPTGSMTEFPIPTAASAPGGIAVGPDGNLWFTETAVKQIGRITPSGTITEFASGSGFPRDIAGGPDGNLWYTANGDPASGLSFIGRITTSGLVAEFQVPTQFAGLGAITAGGDGALWFTEMANNIGRITTVGARFHTVDPCRLVDTRDPDGPFGGPALAGRSVRSFKLAGRCGIPAVAAAVAINVTVTGPTAEGHLRAYPDGIWIPSASSVNYVAGQTRANGAVVRLGYGGVAVYCDQVSGAAHVILDVTGYFK